LGAEIRIVGAGDHDSARPIAKALADDMERLGEKVYFADLATTSAPVVFPAYLLGAEELATQCARKHVRADWLVLPSGSGGTHASMALGLKLLGSHTRVLGIGVRLNERDGRAAVLRAAEVGAARLGIETVLDAAEVNYIDSYRGEGYAQPTPEVLEAIRLVARTEGILLDPVYSGTAMAGLMAEAKLGRIKTTDTVIFLHTGGTPGLFAYNQELHQAASRWRDAA
jgi:1-aminocyclopropane-1-carboxylate deaminase/D-cysteine desulfhydrase-like pyridoxal-dependent ACC family enzyme